MRTVDATLDSPIQLTKTDTNITTTVRFNVKPWLDNYPGCVIELIHRRNKDAGGLPAAILETDGEFAYWLVTEADTAYAGRGEAELRMTCGEAKAKSPTFTTYVDRSVASDEEHPPEPIERFVEQISDAAAEAIDAKNDAVSAKEDAEAAKTAAETAKDDAEEAARQAAAASAHAPYIGENHHWYLWDAEQEQYVDTGVKAEGKDSDPGDDGVSPEVTVTAITGGHQVKITDEAHPDGQTFDVMDGRDGDVPIDDTTPAADKVYSSQKVAAEVSSLNQAIQTLDADLAEEKRKRQAMWELEEGIVYRFDEKTETGMNVAPSGAYTMSLENVQGKSEQGDNPSPENPQEIHSVEEINIRVEKGLQTYLLTDAQWNWLKANESSWHGEGCLVCIRTDLDNRVWIINANSTLDDNKYNNMIGVIADGRTLTTNNNTLYTTDNYVYVYVNGTFVKGDRTPLPYTDIDSVKTINLPSSQTQKTTIERTITPPYPMNGVGTLVDTADVETGNYTFNYAEPLDPTKTVAEQALETPVVEDIPAEDLTFLRSLENLPADHHIFVTDQDGNDVSYLLEYIVSLRGVLNNG